MKPRRLMLCFTLIFCCEACEAWAGLPPAAPPVREPEVPAIPIQVPAVAPSPIPGGTEAPPRAIRFNKSRKKSGGRKKPVNDQDVVQHRVHQSVRRPANSMAVESKTIYSYVPDAIYLVYAALNHVVDVQLQPGEKLTGRIVAGDTHRWEVGTVEDGSGGNVTTHVLIKPKQAGIETNFLIVTDRHSYRLYAQSSDSFFIPTIGWSYPEEEMKKAEQIKAEQQRLDGLVAAPAIIAASLNFKYKVKPDGKYAWTPARVFDDGSKTYIQMNPEVKNYEAPVFFIKDGRDLNLVNYRVRGDYYIVDRLFNEGELRSGRKDRVRIERQRGWFSSEEDRKYESGKAKGGGP